MLWIVIRLEKVISVQSINWRAIPLYLLFIVCPNWNSAILFGIHRPVTEIYIKRKWSCKARQAHLFMTCVSKMFPFSSLAFGDSNNNVTDTEKIRSDCFKYQRDRYHALAVLPKWTILCFYLRSIIIGLWVLLKWAFCFLWAVVNRKSPRFNTNPMEYNNRYLHDKPLPCLVDNHIGLQSYVKLLVFNANGFLIEPFVAYFADDLFFFFHRRTPNCIISKQATEVIRLFYCYMDFPTVGLDGITK